MSAVPALPGGRKSPARVGCCGFPVAQSTYYGTFDVVELDSSFYQPPKPATAERWRAEAPEGFQFIVKAWQLITHLPTSPTYRKLGADHPARIERCGHFRSSPEVRLAWERTLSLARSLKACMVLFQTPPNFRPDPDKLRDLYAFFERIERGNFLVAWEPRGPGWNERLVGRILSDLKLVHAGDPLAAPLQGRIGYFRMHGAYEEGRIVYRHRYSDAELAKVASLARAQPTYVLFNNSEMFRDAGRFSLLLRR
ncbi:MAG: DUF72 domain-containing protein [Elusimicrobia bacterium]|nr:DUF72 domain-containing protein [Elusimicrobiota bacterium]